MKTQAENVIIEEIYDAKEGKNQDYKTCQLVVTTQSTNFLNKLLNSDGFEKRKVAFQSIHKDVIAKYNLEKGSNLGALMGEELRIVHKETLEAGLPGFKPMVIPGKDGAVDTPVLSNGSQIYFKRELGAATTNDTIVARDGVAVTQSSSVAQSVEDQNF